MATEDKEKKTFEELMQENEELKRENEALKTNLKNSSVRFDNLASLYNILVEKLLNVGINQ